MREPVVDTYWSSARFVAAATVILASVLAQAAASASFPTHNTRHHHGHSDHLAVLGPEGEVRTSSSDAAGAAQPASLSDSAMVRRASKSKETQKTLTSVESEEQADEEHDDAVEALADGNLAAAAKKMAEWAGEGLLAEDGGRAQKNKMHHRDTVRQGHFASLAEGAFSAGERRGAEAANASLDPTAEAICPWFFGIHTNKENLMRCYEGACNPNSHEDGWACCAKHGGPFQCPSTRPFICDKLDSACGGYCCKLHCDEDGGTKPCMGPPGDVGGVGDPGDTGPRGDNGSTGKLGADGGVGEDPSTVNVGKAHPNVKFVVMPDAAPFSLVVMSFLFNLVIAGLGFIRFSSLRAKEANMESTRAKGREDELMAEAQLKDEELVAMGDSELDRVRRTLAEVLGIIWEAEPVPEIAEDPTAAAADAAP